jgi:RHS repeat-associated protein
MTHPLLPRRPLWVAAVPALALLLWGGARISTASPAPEASQNEAHLRIDPPGDSWTGTTATHTVTIGVHFCAMDRVTHHDIDVRLDGQGLPTTTFAQVTGSSPCNPGTTHHYILQPTLTLTPGTHTLEAAFGDLSGGSATQTVQFTYTQNAPPPPPPAAVVVTPDNGTSSRPLPGGYAEVFVVRNSGGSPATFTLQGVCSGGAVSGCAASRPSATLNPGDSTDVAVTYTADGGGGGGGGLILIGEGGGPGEVMLKAWKHDATSVRDSGAYTVTVGGPLDGAPTGQAQVGQAGDNSRLDRGDCVVAAAGDGAFECGDLRLAHALPTTRVLNQARTPTLLFNSQHARPHPVIAVPFTPTPSYDFNAPTVQQVRGVIRMGATVLKDTTWTGLSIPTMSATEMLMPAYRFALHFDTELATGFYDYEVELTATYSNGRVEQHGPRPGRMVVVNRKASSFGAGWWLGGLESLHVSAADTAARLWVGGDGSYRLYRRVNPTRWVADAWDGIDSLRYDAATVRYVRTLPGKAEVHFDAFGRHVRTTNVMGHWTDFEWHPTLATQLVRIHMPRAANFNTGYSYLFEYNNTGGKLSRVVPPGIPRAVTVGMSSGRITTLSGPDAYGVGFGYAGTSTVPESRTDRRLVVTTFAFDEGRRLKTVTNTMGTPGTATDDVVLRFRAAESQGITGPVAPADVYTLLDGPRPDADVLDHTKFYLDRWGIPIQVRDAIGRTTLALRSDPRWPGLVTSVTDANGFRTTATHDTRGNLVAQTDWNPRDNGENATTVHRWSAEWDALTETTYPEGEVSRTSYDTSGRRAWEQAGTSDSTRIRYFYHLPTHASAPGLLERMETPSGIERYEYDLRGNLSATVSPGLVRVVLQSDASGRQVGVRTSIDSAQTQFRKDTTVYTLADRVEHAESWAPVNSLGQALPGLERVVVDHGYDPEGNPTFVSRLAVPDTAGITTVTTRWEYDALGRRTVEVHPDGTPANLADNPRDSTYYDAAGNVTRVSTRRLMATRQGTSFSQVGGQVTMVYDALDRLVKRRRPQVVYPQRKDGIAKYRKDSGENPPYPYYPNDAAGGFTIAGDSATFTYHLSGGVLQADNPDARVSRTYYPNGQLRTETQRIRTMVGANFTDHQYALEYRYDRNGRTTGLRHPSQLGPTGNGNDWNTYGYNGLGSLHGVTDALGKTVTYQYAADGTLVGITRPAGVQEQLTNTADGLVRLQAVTGPGGGLRNVRFRYDARGKLLWSGNTVLRRDTMWATYSPLGNAIKGGRSHRGVNLAQGPQRTAAWETSRYDALGRRTHVSSADTTWLETYVGRGASVSAVTSRGEAFRYAPGMGRLRANNDSIYYDADGNTEFNTKHGDEGAERVSFYAADGTLMAAELRLSAGPEGSLLHNVFEDYRYDALGRRVWTRARRWCHADPWEGFCRISKVRRTVWDGSREFYEIQMPGDSTLGYLENDVGPVTLPRDNSSFPVDPNPFFGRVAYAYGHGTDQPLSIVRMGYADLLDANGQLVGRWTAAPFSIFPLWSTRGQGDLGVFEDGALTRCVASLRCVRISWPGTWFDLVRPRVQRNSWHGSLLEDKEDATGTLYRRNRSYDPGTGQFTQEDPIGLGGGLNLYGFADGDPVNYGDPFGLFATGWGEDEEEFGPDQTGPRPMRRVGTFRPIRGSRDRGYDLQRHEGQFRRRSGGQPGHTLAEHVNVSRRDIQRRARNGGQLASRFHSRREAERLIAQVIGDRQFEIERWLRTAADNRLPLVNQRPGGITGEVARPNGSVTQVTGMTIILRRGRNGSYYIETAYPTR